MSERREAARVACLLVADLPRAATLRAHPELAGRPFAVSEGPGPRARVLSVSDEATARGVVCGLGVAEARSRCAALEVHVVSPALEQAAHAALQDAALACSPLAEREPRRAGAYAIEAAVAVDATGIATAARPASRGRSPRTPRRWGCRRAWRSRRRAAWRASRRAVSPRAATATPACWPPAPRRRSWRRCRSTCSILTTRWPSG
jgi:hypothetical protein